MGYLLRLSYLNGLKDPKFFPRSNFNISDYMRPDLPVLLGLRPDAFKTSPYQPSLNNPFEIQLNANPLSSWHLHLAAPKVCPCCLKERALLPAAWDLTLWVACPEHSKSMLHRCPECSQPIRWWRPSFFHCWNCRADLREATTETAKASQTIFTALVSNKLGNHRKFDIPSEVEDVFGHLSAAAILKLCFLFGRPDRVKLYGRHLAREIVEKFFPILRHWPIGLHDFFDECNAKTKDGPSHYYHFQSRSLIRTRLSEQCFRFIDEEFIRYRGLRGNEAPDGKFQQFMTTSISRNADFMHIKNFVEITGLPESVVVPAIRENRIPFTVCRDQSGRERYLLRVSWVRTEEWVALVPHGICNTDYKLDAMPEDVPSGYLRLSDAILRLGEGNTRQSLYDLVRHGYVIEKEVPYKPLRNSPTSRKVYCQASIDRMLSQLERISQPLIYLEPGVCCVVRDRYKRGGPPTLSTIVALAFQGRIKLHHMWKSRSGFGRYCISQAEIRKHSIESAG